MERKKVMADRLHRDITELIFVESFGILSPLPAPTNNTTHFKHHMKHEKRFRFGTSRGTLTTNSSGFRGRSRKVNAGQWELFMLEGTAGAGLERVLCKLLKKIGFDPWLVAIYWKSWQIIKINMLLKLDPGLAARPKESQTHETSVGEKEGDLLEHQHFEKRWERTPVLKKPS